MQPTTKARTRPNHNPGELVGPSVGRIRKLLRFGISAPIIARQMRVDVLAVRRVESEMDGIE